LGRLRTLLAPHAAPEAPPLSPAQRNFLCEVAADLKGKYASALMGATASIVAEGTWSGVDVEPVLFPEKVDEFRRNGELVCALRRTLEAIAELRGQVPFAELLERWRAGARVDPYALADLATFRGILGQLLKRNLRRAFYSGDYHQIQRREAALASTIAALEATHHRTWAEAADAGAATAYRQLQDLTLQTVAILDLELLEQLLGSRAIKDLRAAVVTERAAQKSGKSGERRRLPAELETLMPLVAREDLRSFLELLLGSVMKRASVVAVTRLVSAVEEGAPAPAPEPADELLPSIADEEVPPAVPEVVPLTPLRLAAAPPPPASPPARVAPPTPPAPSAEAPIAPAPPPSVAPEPGRETVEQLHGMLVALQSADNQHWSSFRMLQRLVGRHTRIPPSMVQGAHPFVYEVLNSLVPQLEAAAALGAVPQEARKRLVECCLSLSDDRLTPDQMVDEVPANLARLHRLLEGLTAATAARLRG
ncbi:MAG TPA: hypothetical protein VGV61_07690, partial [Thermoanaerobaculia bacterium]|nr:hypothetical protein [Thermoanaerobaculia bacterium]